MALENRKQLLFLVMAVAVGLIAVFVMSAQLESKMKADRDALAQQFDASQKEMAAQLSQQSEAQINAVREEVQKVRAEQQEALQAQMAALQAAQEAKQTDVKKPKPSLALRTPAGKRAVTVMIDSLAAVGGLINAGDKVDVIAHLDVPEATGNAEAKSKSVTAMIFQSLEVLAVNTNLDEPGMYDDQQAAPTLKITFAVDPQESGLLAFADRNGKLELALRNSEESDKQMVKASTWKTLADYVLQNQGANIRVPDEDVSKEDAPLETKPAIQIFRGGKEL